MIAMCAVEASSSGMGGIKMQTKILYINFKILLKHIKYKMEKDI